MGEPLDALRQLIAVAAMVGFDQAKLNEATDELVAMALRIAELERQADMRKTATADLADRVGRASDAMERNGTARRIPILCERFDRSRGRIYQLLKLYRVRQHKFPV
jgi:hypothetical protein